MIKDPTSSKWRSGDYKPIASCSIEETALLSKTGRMFVEGFEVGMGNWVAIGGELPSGKQIEIIKYLDDPKTPEFVIRIDEAECAAQALVEILQILNLHKDDLTWVSPET